MDQPGLSLAGEAGYVDAVAENLIAVSEAAPFVSPEIAPWWHSVAMLVGLLGFVLIGQLPQSTTSHAAPRFSIYASQVLFIWLLLGSTVAGIRDREAFFRANLSAHALQWTRELRRGFCMYLIAILLAAVTSVALRSTERVYERRHTAAARSATQDAFGATPSDTVTKPHQASLFDTRKIHMLAPQTSVELLAWMLVSISAGFCEELIFRGYWLAQAKSLFARLRFADGTAAIASVIVTSLLFGSMHVYQGIGGAFVVAVLGAVYAVARVKYRNLRSCIVAHAMQDVFAGVVLFLQHLHATSAR